MSVRSSLCAVSVGPGRCELRFVDVGNDPGVRDEALAEVAWDLSIAAVAIDGPLVPGLSTTKRYRSAEALLSRGVFQRRGKPGPINGLDGPRLHAVATWWALLVSNRLNIVPCPIEGSVSELPIVEAFPNAFLGVIVDDDAFPRRPTRGRMWTDTLFALPSVQQGIIAPVK